MYLIDTDIFLELLLHREKGEICQAFLEKLERKQIECVCTHFAVHSVIIALERRGKMAEAKRFLNYVISLPGLLVVDFSVKDEIKVLEMMSSSGLDFDDSLQACVALETGCEGIVTLDSDFKNSGVKIFRPEEVA